MISLILRWLREQRTPDSWTPPVRVDLEPSGYPDSARHSCADYLTNCGMEGGRRVACEGSFPATTCQTSNQFGSEGRSGMVGIQVKRIRA